MKECVGLVLERLIPWKIVAKLSSCKLFFWLQYAVYICVCIYIVYIYIYTVYIYIYIYVYIFIFMYDVYLYYIILYYIILYYIILYYIYIWYIWRLLKRNNGNKKQKQWNGQETRSKVMYAY